MADPFAEQGIECPAVFARQHHQVDIMCIQRQLPESLARIVLCRRTARKFRLRVDERYALDFTKVKSRQTMPHAGQEAQR
jgi:hypothetical protein